MKSKKDIIKELALHKKDVILKKVGNDSIGVKTTSKNILKMRDWRTY